MGIFGTAILQDDTVADVVAFIVDRMKAGSAITDASSEAVDHFRELEDDEDEYPLLWLAIASVQWRYGAVEAFVLNKIRSDISAERGLSAWREDAKLLIKRKTVLSNFLTKIESPNPRPSLPPRSINRLAPFKAGDCLSILTSDGRYTAALVLQVDNSNLECGKNLIAGLDYLDDQPPLLNVFVQRQWLEKNHGAWNGAPDISWYLPVRFKQERKRITLVGNINLLPNDPKNINLHCGWNLIGQQILLCRSAGRK